MNIVYMYKYGDISTGLICTITDVAKLGFSFYVWNGAWDGVFTNGMVYCVTTGRYADDIYVCTTDESKIPPKFDLYIQAIKTKDKVLLGKARSGELYQ